MNLTLCIMLTLSDLLLKTTPNCIISGDGILFWRRERERESVCVWVFFLSFLTI